MRRHIWWLVSIGLTLLALAVLSGSNSSTLLEGGGLFTTIPVTLTDNTITKNTPDNCSGTLC